MLKMISETCRPVVMDQVLTHQRTEGDDSQQSLDQNTEPVSQSSVIATVRIRFINVRHVCHFKNAIFQESFHQETPAVSVHVHVDTIKRKKKKQPFETKGALPRWARKRF